MQWWMQAMPAIVDALLRLSMQAGVLVLLVLGVQSLLGSHIPPRWRYRLWALVLVRLLIPISPASNLSLYNLVPAQEAPMRGVPVHIDTSPVFEPSLVVAPLPAFDRVDQPTLHAAVPWRWQHIAAILWLIGAAALAGVVMWSNLRLRRRLAGSVASDDPNLLDLLERCRREMGLGVAPRLVLSDAVPGPALAGLGRPRLLLPPVLARQLDREQLRHVFLHEMAHYKCRDLHMDWLATALLVLHWFNPLLWLALARARADREMARDAMVLAVIGGGAQDYGQTVLQLVGQIGSGRAAAGTVGITEGKRQLRRRIELIGANKHAIAGGAVLAVGVMVVLAVVALTDRTAPEPRSGSAPDGPTAAADDALTPKTLPVKPGTALAIEVYDVRDLVMPIEPDVGRDGGTSLVPTRQEPVVAQAATESETRRLVQLIRDTVEPDSWVNGTSIIARHGQLIITNTPNAHAKISQTLGLLREMQGWQSVIEAEMLAVPAQQLNRVGAVVQLRDGVPPDEQQTATIRRMLREAPGVRTLMTPRLVVYNAVRAEVSDTEPVTYVSDYTVSRSDSGQTTFTPVMSTTRQGVVFAVRPTITPDRKSITLTVKPTWTRLLSLKKVPVSATQPAAGLTIEQPEYLIADIGTILTCPSSQWRVLGWPAGSPSQTMGEQLIVLVRASVDEGAMGIVGAAGN